VPTPERLGRWIAAALCAGAVLWAVLVPLAPVLAAGAATDGVTAAVAIPYAAGALVCHQRADRSFFTRGMQWPVCARCAGLYLAAAAGMIATLLLPAPWRHHLRHVAFWRTALVAAALPTAASWAAEQGGMWRPEDLARAWLAVPLGAAMGALVALAARGVLTDVPKT